MFTLLALACTPETAANVEPDVSITSPSGDDEIRAGEPVRIIALVSDEAGPDGLDLVWTIEPEPESTGTALLTEDEATYYLDDGLEEGVHKITLTATDYADLSGSDSQTLDILENDRPTVKIKLPEGDEEYRVEDPLIVHIEVDAKDDAMSNIRLFWGGVADNAPEAPSYPPSQGIVIFRIENVEAGDHELVVTARDGGGRDDTERVNFTVR